MPPFNPEDRLASVAGVQGGQGNSEDVALWAVRG
jgi:hypothetical protein